MKSLTSETATCTWHMDTKYYTAVSILTARGLGSHSMDADVCPEALVAVFDASQEVTFRQLVTWWGSNEKCRSWEIGLVVANKMDLVKENKPGWLNEAEEWASDRMLEYIEASAGDSVLDMSLHGQGTRRVKEALEAHMWPGMVLKPFRPSAQTSPPHSSGCGKIQSCTLMCQSALALSLPLSLESGHKMTVPFARLGTKEWLHFSSDDDCPTHEVCEGSTGPCLFTAQDGAENDMEGMVDDFDKLLLNLHGQ